jgi:hypothetical protein
VADARDYGILSLAVIRFLARLVHGFAWRVRLMEYAWSLVEKELASKVRVPWRARPALWRRGFLGEAAVLYGFHENSPRAYLSDYARFVKTCLINGPYGILLDDKLLFARIMRDHAGYLPVVFGILSDGIVIGKEASDGPAADVPLTALLRTRRDLVLKPVNGGGGRGVVLLHARSCRFTVNGRDVDEKALIGLAVQWNGHMVSSYVRQHPALCALYPAATNTIRILTMRDDDGVFIAAAVLRIGTERSKPLDNWSRGGLSAAIDRGSGRLGRAASYPVGGDRLEWHARHPETGASIEGMLLPNWQQISAAVLEVARTLLFLPYVGWDIVVTEDGFRIIEGNRYSDVNLLQIHSPLLADKRVLAFYQRHGAARRYERES